MMSAGINECIVIRVSFNILFEYCLSIFVTFFFFKYAFEFPKKNTKIEKNHTISKKKNLFD